MSREKPLQTLQALEQQRARLLAELRRPAVFVVGTVSEVRARCGKSGCHCTRGPGHPQMRLLYAKGGRRRCKLVRKGDEARIRQAGARYRALKTALRALAALQTRELRLLRRLVRVGGLRYR